MAIPVEKVQLLQMEYLIDFQQGPEEKVIEG